MKFKNINPVERHVEKVILGLCVLALLAVVYAYVVANPFTTDMNGTQVAPDQIAEQLRIEAERLKMKINSGEPDPKLLQWKVPDYVRQLQQRIEQPVTESMAFANLSGASTYIVIGDRPDSGNTSVSDIVAQYHEPVIPAPANVVARPDLGTLSDTAVRGQPDLAKLVGQPPYDLQWVAMAATFDAAQLRQSLSAPSDGRRQQIRPSWWKNTLAISDVQVQREERLPDGTWGNATLLAPAPDRPSMRSRLDKVTRRTLNSQVTLIRQQQAGIVQPAGYELSGGRTWLAPELDLPEEVAPINEPTNPRLRPPTPPRYPGNMQDPAMYEPEFMPPDMMGPTMIDQSRPDAGPVDPLSANRIELWAYDLQAEPGRQYRYRLRVGVVNPLFERPLSAEQAPKYKDAFQLFSPWSDWVEVQTLRKRYEFLVSANKPPFNQAQVEIWQFSDGNWRTATFAVTPGDTIGAETTNHKPLIADLPIAGAGGMVMDDVPKKVDFRTNTTMVDLDFRHRSGLGSIEDPRLLYLDAAGNILARQMLEDRARHSETKKMIVEANPELVRLMEEQKAREAAEREAKRLERERANAERRQNRPTRDRTTPDYPQPEFIPQEFR